MWQVPCRRVAGHYFFQILREDNHSRNYKANLRYFDQKFRACHEARTQLGYLGACTPKSGNAVRQPV